MRNAWTPCSAEMGSYVPLHMMLFYTLFEMHASPCHACTALQSRPHYTILPAYYTWLDGAA